MNENVFDEKDINDEILSEYFWYQNLSVLAKDLLKANQAKNDHKVDQVNDSTDWFKKSCY